MYDTIGVFISGYFDGKLYYKQQKNFMENKKTDEITYNFNDHNQRCKNVIIKAMALYLRVKKYEALTRVLKISNPIITIGIKEGGELYFRIEKRGSGVFIVAMKTYINELV